MATGYEDYILYVDSQPSVAYTKVGQHLAALLALQAGPAVSADGVSYNPAHLQAAIDTARKDWNQLRTVTQRVGIPRLVPTRRIDGAPWTTPGQGSN